MYVRVAGRMLLFLALDVREGTTGRPLPIVHRRTRGDHRMSFANSTQTYTGGPPYVRYFLNIHWIILGHTIHLLDHCVNNTRHTLGLANVCYFFRELVAPLSYKYPYLHSFFTFHFHLLARPQATKIEFLWVLSERESFVRKELIFLPLSR